MSKGIQSLEVKMDLENKSMFRPSFSEFKPLPPSMPSPLGNNPFAGIRSYAYQDKKTRRTMAVECALILVREEIRTEKNDNALVSRDQNNTIKVYADWIEEALQVNEPSEQPDKNA